MPRGEIKRLVFLLAWVAVTAVAAGEPYTPGDDHQVLERARSPAAAHAPMSQDAAVAFARAAIETGRVQSDPRYGGYAQAVLAPWWSLPRPPDDVLLLRATLQQQRHEFAAALTDLNTLIAREPAHAQARWTRAVVHQVQARYALAMQDCRALFGSAGLLQASTCIASVQSLTGKAGPALDLLDSLADRRDAAALTLAAEIAARLGRADTGARFQAALAFAPSDPSLRIAYADFLLDNGRPAAAAAILSKHALADAALLRLALAERALAQTPSYRDRLQQRFDEATQRGERVHLREQAMGALHLQDRAADALALAVQNWRVQREPADARIVLEAALATRQPQAATEVLEWMRTTGIEDVWLRALAARLR